MKLYQRGGVWWVTWYEGGKRVRRSTKCRDVDLARRCAAAIELENLGLSEDESTDGFVYFARRGPDGPVKIGRAGDVSERMSRLQTACAERLELLCAVPGGSLLERALHLSFARHRVSGEWFRPSRDVLQCAWELSRMWARIRRKSGKKHCAQNVAENCVQVESVDHAIPSFDAGFHDPASGTHRE